MKNGCISAKTHGEILCMLSREGVLSRYDFINQYTEEVTVSAKLLKNIDIILQM